MSLFFSGSNATSLGTKEKIIFLLAKEWPQSTKEIHSNLKKNFTISISYQAVHKLVKQLLEINILEFKNKKYLLNFDWIKNTSQFFETSLNNYSNESIIKTGFNINLDLNEIQYVNFNYLHELRNLFWAVEANQRRKIIEDKENERIICINLQHCIGAIANPENEYDHMKNLKKIKAKQFTLIRGDTILDHYVKDFYEKNENKAVNIKLGVKDIALVSEQWAFYDLLVEVYFSNDFLILLDKIYNSITNLSDLNLNSFFKELRDMPYQNRAIIHKNREYVKEVKLKTMSYFLKKDNI